MLPPTESAYVVQGRIALEKVQEHGGIDRHDGTHDQRAGPATQGRDQKERQRQRRVRLHPPQHERRPRPRPHVAPQEGAPAHSFQRRIRCPFSSGDLFHVCLFYVSGKAARRSYTAPPGCNVLRMSTTSRTSNSACGGAALSNACEMRSAMPGGGGWRPLARVRRGG